MAVRYRLLTEDKCKEILQDRLHTLEIDHYVTSISLKELEGIEDSVPDTELMAELERLSTRLSGTITRISNITELLDDLG